MGGGDGRPGRTRAAGVPTLPPLPGDRARDLLADLVRLYEEGLSAPLPLPLKTGERYADARHRGLGAAKALDLAATSWAGTKFPGENQEAANVRVWGRDCTFEALLAAVGSPGTAGTSEPVRRPGRCGCGSRCCSTNSAVPAMTAPSSLNLPDQLQFEDEIRRPDRIEAFDACAARCRPAPPCWRPAPAPGRPTPSALSSPGTSPRGSPRLDELLVVTFGRAASQELRERVRGHLVRAERALADPRRPGRQRSGAPLLADGTGRRGAMRRERLRTALAGFDAATIVTTHQFCQYV